MRLITRHPKYFNITKDVSDISQSEILNPRFDTGNIFKDAYTWLFNILGNNQYIWCYVDGTHNLPTHGAEHVAWILDVPDSECIKINETVWHMVINGGPYFECPDDLPDAEFDKLWKHYDKIKYKTWEENIFKVTDEKDMQVLIKSPVLEKYVIEKRWECEIDYDFLTQDSLKMGFTHREDAFKKLESMQGALDSHKKPYMYTIHENKDNTQVYIDMNN